MVSGQTDTDKAFIGMYQDFNTTDSRNPQDYRWSKWKGSDGRDGIPGKAGADGRTPYVHFVELIELCLCQNLVGFGIDVHPVHLQSQGSSPF